MERLKYAVPHLRIRGELTNQIEISVCHHKTVSEIKHEWLKLFETSSDFIKEANFCLNNLQKNAKAFGCKKRPPKLIYIPV